MNETIRSNRAGLPGALLVALLTFLVAPGRPAEAAFPGQNGDLAFERFGDIYLAGPDGPRKIDVAGVRAEGRRRVVASHRQGSLSFETRRCRR
ncbi:MAG: hypothetical protein AVDCRST_MAG03-876 [uncultured Rubrobacteraceae bacterium]|uniref:Uncharacterized protein n=1 Tax=uncultured Rubrobacteraceae bacterium TaxID=349277 RepID=A0A6J4NRK6_9ACTN|nr:MAG: hypothetical protein AVDCRST_MAG03-876 [uncultured Rubrobacteraceae bacterium]